MGATVGTFHWRLIMDIYVSIEGSQTGPFSLEEVRKMVESGRYASDYGWHQGLNGWIPLSQILDIGQKAVPPATSPTAAPPQSNASTNITLPSWCPKAIWIGGGLFCFAIVLGLICHAKVESFNDAQESWGGLGEVFRELSGQADTERSGISFVSGFADLVWWAGLLVWGTGTIRWGYWALCERPKITFLGYGHVDVPGFGFKFQPPAGWSIETVSGDPIPFCFGGVRNNFRPNIYFNVNGEPGTLETIWEMDKAITMKQALNVTELSRRSFTTDQGIVGLRGVIQINADSRYTRVVSFIFKRSDGANIHLYCTTLASDGHIFDSMFDACAAAMTLL